MATLRTKSQENGSIVRLEQIPASNEWHGSASRDRDALARVQKKQVITVSDPFHSTTWSLISE